MLKGGLINRTAISDDHLFLRERTDEHSKMQQVHSHRMMNNLYPCRRFDARIRGKLKF